MTDKRYIQKIYFLYIVRVRYILYMKIRRYDYLFEAHLFDTGICKSVARSTNTSLHGTRYVVRALASNKYRIFAVQK